MPYKNVPNVQENRIMVQFFSPSQVAEAIQSSESSVKRWCDDGVIFAERTAGGHRRVPLHAVARFLRSSAHRLHHPEALGLPPLADDRQRSTAAAVEHIREGLLAGDEQQVRRTLLRLYLGGEDTHVLCDSVLAPVLADIGLGWRDGNVEIYQERLACEIVARALHELRNLTPAPPSSAPLAIGGTASGDDFALPTLMVELVLRELGWKAVSLGTQLPFSTLDNAVQRQRPRLFWLSVSSIPDRTDFVARYNQLVRSLPPRTVSVLGGRALDDELLAQLIFTMHCRNLQQLVHFARAVG
jgi:methanogenic corrinoid protein MtbC1